MKAEEEKCRTALDALRAKETEKDDWGELVAEKNECREVVKATFQVRKPA